MSEQYRLIFRGEVSEGQHSAVVKKKLGEALKLEKDKVEALFSGKTVVIRKSADRSTAARFQSAFKGAGAILRVSRLDTPEKVADSAKETPASKPEEGSWEVMPAGSDVLRESERHNEKSRDIDTSHLGLQGAAFSAPDEREEVAGPDVSHLDIAEAGARIGPEKKETEVQIDVNFDLAEVGSDVGQASSEIEPVDLSGIDFDIADPGAQLGVSDSQPPPPAPDVSHITVESKE